MRRTRLWLVRLRAAGYVGTVEVYNFNAGKPAGTLHSFWPDPDNGHVWMSGAYAANWSEDEYTDPGWYSAVSVRADVFGSYVDVAESGGGCVPAVGRRGERGCRGRLCRRRRRRRPGRRVIRGWLLTLDLGPLVELDVGGKFPFGVIAWGGAVLDLFTADRGGAGLVVPDARSERQRDPGF